MIPIRPAQPEDEAALVAIDEATWSPDVTPAGSDERHPVFFGEQVRPEDVLVAVDGADVVGYVQLRQPIGLASHRHVLEINGLAVDPAHQGRAIGRSLVEAALHEARGRGVRKVTLRVLSTNASAQRLYESCGFVVEGVLRGEFVLQGRPVDDVLMAWTAADGSHPLG